MSIKTKVIYLAGCYTAYHRYVRQIRFHRLTKTSAMMVAKGYVNFSPITQSHEQCLAHQLPHTWKFWRRVDTAILERCDEIWILDDKGWNESVGVTAEIKIAKRLKIPIKMIHLTELEDELYLYNIGEVTEKVLL